MAAVLVTVLLAGCEIGDDRGYLTTKLHQNGFKVSRDCGYSADLGNGQSLWVFCDTFVWDKDGDVLYATDNSMAVGPHQALTAPSGLDEIGLYGVLPAQPVRELTDAEVDCALTENAPWPSGAVRIPDTRKVLIPYVSICRGAPEDPDSTGWVNARPSAFGYAEYDIDTKQTVTTAPAVFWEDWSPVWTLPIPQQQQLGQPIFTEDYLYLSRGMCDGNTYLWICQPTPNESGASPDAMDLSGDMPPPPPADDDTLGASLYVARVALDGDWQQTRPWEDPANYEWFAGPGWSSDWNSAIHAGPPEFDASTSGSTMMYQAGLYGGPYVLIEPLDGVSKTRIWTGPSPIGPWSNRIEGTLGCTEARICYSPVGHPQLGHGAGRLMLSYFQSGDANEDGFPLPPEAGSTEHQIRFRDIHLPFPE